MEKDDEEDLSTDKSMDSLRPYNNNNNNNNENTSSNYILLDQNEMYVSSIQLKDKINTKQSRHIDSVKLNEHLPIDKIELDGEKFSDQIIKFKIMLFLIIKIKIG